MEDSSGEHLWVLQGLGQLLVCGLEEGSWSRRIEDSCWSCSLEDSCGATT